MTESPGSVHFAGVGPKTPQGAKVPPQPLEESEIDGFGIRPIILVTVFGRVSVNVGI